MIRIREHITNEPEKEYSELVSLEHRKKFAQFFTPIPIAEFMAKWVLGNKSLKTVLDPAFGLGVFARTIRQTNKNWVSFMKSKLCLKNKSCTKQIGNAVLYIT